MIVRVESAFRFTELPPQRRWRYVLDEPLQLSLPELLLGTHDFADEYGKVWLSLRRKALIVHEGYAWNGCSPKWGMFGKWIGTPDFAGTVMASGVHDSLCQFSHCRCMPLERGDIDEVFGAVMRLHGFRAWWLYYGAVAALGGVYRLFSHDTSGECLCPHPGKKQATTNRIET